MYQEQSQLNAPHSLRQVSTEGTAKANIERNKMKLKLRGLSKDKLNQIGEASKMEIRGTCSNAYEYCT